jgi:hypothetical protein
MMMMMMMVLTTTTTTMMMMIDDDVDDDDEDAKNGISINHNDWVANKLVMTSNRIAKICL